MLFNYKDYLDGLDRQAYHEGEWQWEEDGYTVTRTYNWSAPGCHNSCGVLYFVKDGRLERVEGDPLDPQAGGKLCMRCLDMVEAVYDPNRPLYPMKRAKEDRGKNTWERITWDEALDIVADYIHDEIDAKGYGRESINVVHGTGRNVSSWVPFMGGACFGTPNVGGPGFSGWSCYLPRVCGCSAIIGDFTVVDASQTHPDRYADADWVRPDVIVIWGNEPLKSNADAFLGHWLNVCVQLGSKIICVDPMLTWWSARAEYWLPLRPGTDEALALAMVHVLCWEDLVDHDFIDRWCAYYDDLKAHVEDFTPEWAGEICGLDPELIRGAARFYGNAERGALQWGLALDMQKCSLYLVVTLSDFMALCGNVDAPGTNIIVHNAFEINPGYATSQLYVDPEMFTKKLTIDKLDPNLVPFIGTANPDAVQKAIEAQDPYPMRMCWIQSSNSVACSAQSANRNYNNLRSYDFLVVADPVMSPTAMACADLFLPVKMSCERDSIRAWWSPLRAMKGVVQTGEALSDEELIVAVGLKLNPELFERRWPTAVDLIQDALDIGLSVQDENGKFYTSAGRSQAGMIEVDDLHTEYFKAHQAAGDGSFQELVERGGHEYDTFCHTYYKYEKGMLRKDGQPGFPTPTGRIELIPFNTFQAWGIDPYPVHVESITSERLLHDPEYKAEYPFVLINGGRSYEFFHSEHRNMPTMREFHPDPLVKIHPDTCARLGIREGDWVWLENTEGRCRQKVAYDAALNPEWVHAEHGWWFPEADPEEPSLFGVFESNVNNLTHNIETGAGGIGCPIKSVACKVYKCTPENSRVLPGEQVTRRGGFKTWKAMEPFGFPEGPISIS